MAILRFFCAVAVLSTQLSTASAAGCEAKCEEDSGKLTFKGVDDIIVTNEGGTSISLNQEVNTIEEQLSSTNTSINAELEVVDKHLEEVLNTTVEASVPKVDQLLYVTLRERINKNRLAIRKERELLNNHLECGRKGLIYHVPDGKCIPPTIPRCGPLPLADNRVRSLVDCTGLLDTECETHCDKGWKGENVTYVCTGKNDDKGGWKRVAASSNLDQSCYNVDECSAPDYPCHDNLYLCTDTEGSFSCDCHESMVESEEKQEFWPDGALSGRGKTCVCPSETQWLVYEDESPPAPKCVCPFGGNTGMVLDESNHCACPKGSFKDKSPSAYPSVGLTGVMNQKDINKNYHCNYFPDCQAAYNAGAIRQGNGVTDVTLRAPGGNNPIVSAVCITESLAGFGTRSHTHVKCNALKGTNDYSNSCTHTQKANDWDTCKANGYLKTPFRSLNHYKQAWNKFGTNLFRNYYGKQIYGIYSTTRGATMGRIRRSSRRWTCRRWIRQWRWWWPRWRWWCQYGWQWSSWWDTSQQRPMKSNAGQYVGGANNWWRSIDNGPWWIRDSNFNEPNGDYSAYHHLHTNTWSLQSWGYSWFNDAWSGPWSGGNYFCGHKFWTNGNTKP